MTLFTHLALSDTSFQYLMSATAQVAAAVLALALTGRLIVAGLTDASERPPVRFLRRLGFSDFVYLLLALVTMSSLVLLLLGWRPYADVPITLMAVAIVLLWVDWKQLVSRTPEQAFLASLVRAGRHGAWLSDPDADYLLDRASKAIGLGAGARVKALTFFMLTGASRNHLAGLPESTRIERLLSTASDSDMLEEALRGCYFAGGPFADPSTVLSEYRPALREAAAHALVKIAHNYFSFGLPNSRFRAVRSIRRKAFHALTSASVFMDPHTRPGAPRNPYYSSSACLSAVEALRGMAHDADPDDQQRFLVLALNFALEHQIAVLLEMSGLSDERVPAQAHDAMVVWCLGLVERVPKAELLSVLSDRSLPSRFESGSPARRLACVLYADPADKYDRSPEVPADILAEAWNVVIARALNLADWPAVRGVRVPLVELDDMSVQSLSGTRLRQEFKEWFREPDPADSDEQHTRAPD